MRYMNLACLLVTLVCLVAILLLTGSSPNATNKPAQPARFMASSQQAEAGDSSKRSLVSSSLEKSQQQKQPQTYTDFSSESLDSLDSQPLVSDSEQAQVTTQAPAGDDATNKQPLSANESPFDEDSSNAERHDNKSSPRHKLLDSSQLERELERAEATAGSGSSFANTEPSLGFGEPTGWPHHPFRQPPGGSLIDPILSQLFNDLDPLGNLFRPLRRLAASATNGSSSQPTVMVAKPIIRRFKNGATIVISGSTRTLAANDSDPLGLGSLTSNDSSLLQPATSLLERLLPPMLRPISSGSAHLSTAGSGSPMMVMMMMKPTGSGSSSSPEGANGTTRGMATITIGSSSDPPMPPFAARGLSPFSDPFGDLFGPPPQPLGSQQRPSGSMFMEASQSMPFGPMFMPPPPPMPLLPPQGLIRMLMRQAMADVADDEPPFQGIRPLMRSPSTASNKESTSKNSSDTAPSQNSPTISSRLAGPEASSDELETLQDSASVHQNQPQGASSFLSRPPGSDRSEFLLFPPLGRPAFIPAPPMVLMGSGQSGGLNLRTILSHIMPEMASRFQSPSVSVRINGITADTDKMVAGANKSAASAAAAVAAAAAASQPQPSWFAAGPQSAIDPDDEWTSLYPAGDSSPESHWASSGSQHEAQQSKNMRARHRDSDSEMEPTGEATEFVASGAVNGPMESVTSQRSFRRPGIIYEWSRNFNNFPGRAVQLMPPGMRSQSLSRAPPVPDFESNEPESNQQPPKPHFLSGGSIFAPVGSMRAESRSDSLVEQPPVGGLIGRFLSDLSRSGEPQSAPTTNPGRLGRGRSLLQDDSDLDEGDSEEQQLQRPSPAASPAATITWPRVTARIRMRPLTSARIESRSLDAPDAAIFMAPAHITIPDQPADSTQSSPNDLSDLPARSLFGHPHQHQRPTSLIEDTLNSMENRLNHVLAVAKSSPTSSNMDSDEESDEVPHLKSRVDSMRSSDQSEPQLQPRGLIPHHHHQQQQQQQHHSQAQTEPAQTKLQQQPAVADNPFTSPSSPLFGFPTSSMASSKHQQQPASSISGQNNSATSGQVASSSGNRQQRAFTYHSNHEVASPFVANNNKQQQVASQESMGRARFLPLAPANIVMGRRLDDQPLVFGADPSPSYDQSVATTGNLQPVRNPSSSSSFGPAASSANFRTIVV